MGHPQVLGEVELEGDVFVGDFWAGGAGAHGFFGGSGVIEVFGAGGAGTGGTSASGHAFGAATEHAEIAGDDFKAGALLAFLILPLAGLDAAFDENERALLQILLGDFCLFAPNNNLVPFGALLTLAIAVFVGFVGGKGKIGDGLPAGGEARFGIAAEAAD